MKRIYFFMFLSAWMFAACSSTGDTVKSDASAMEPSQEVQATAPAAETPSEAKAQVESNEVFNHSGAGFSMTKPGNWKYMSPETVKAASQSVKMDDKELEKMIKENPNAPLVVITRYQEPYPTLNPSVSVRVIQIPVEGMAPKDILNMSMEGFKRAFPDMTYVDKVQDANVDGINSAYTKIKYTVAAGDQKFPTLARMWMVPRGTNMFIVGMSGPQDGPDVSEESFGEILKSIKIQQ